VIPVLVLNRRFEAGGAERQLASLLAGLDKERFEVTVATFYDGGEFAAEVREMRAIRWIVLNKRSRWDVVGVTWKLRRPIRRSRPAIIYGYMGPTHALALCLGRLFGAKVVWAVRASNMDLSHYDKLSRLSFWLECRLARYADLIIANSRAGRNYVVGRGFPPAKTLVIENGIDIERFRPDTDARNRLRMEWGAGPEVMLIGLVARLDPMKDHSTFLRGFAMIAGKNVHARAVCVGDGPHSYAATLRQLVQDLGITGQVLWTGLRTDLPAVYNALDLAVSSSIWGEGFSNALGEAMASGLACVATDVGDSRLIVGDTGEIVVPGDPIGLAQALERLLARLGSGNYADQHHRVATSRDRIRKHYSVERMVRRTERALGDLVARASA
jgi:glycosyltransferase involved in cell wall biosynthesis